MRVLVTGATGFVGKYLVHHLLEHGDTVVGTGLSSPETHSLPIQVASLDLRDSHAIASLVEEVQPDVIYHLGGIAFVPQADLDFEQTLAINVGGTHSVFRAASLLKETPKVVLVSTGEVYGKVMERDLPITEEHPIHPANNYSLTKVMAETVAHRYGREASIAYVIVRPFNHIGAGQDDRFVVSTFARQLARIAVGKHAPEMYVGNLEAERDFSDVRDIVRAYRLAALNGAGAFNLGSGTPTSIRDILQHLIAISAQSVTIHNDPLRQRPSENPKTFTATRKAKSELDWEVRISLVESLKAVYEYWLEKERVGPI